MPIPVMPKLMCTARPLKTREKVEHMKTLYGHSTTSLFLNVVLALQAVWLITWNGVVALTVAPNMGNLHELFNIIGISSAFLGLLFAGFPLYLACEAKHLLPHDLAQGGPKAIVLFSVMSLIGLVLTVVNVQFYIRIARLVFGTHVPTITTIVVISVLSAGGCTFGLADIFLPTPFKALVSTKERQQLSEGLRRIYSNRYLRLPVPVGLAVGLIMINVLLANSMH